MASRAQIKANRANAQRSTGPRTIAGKEAVKYNRTCHGLAGKQIVIDDEDPEAYEALRQDLVDGYNPANAAELALVEEVAQNFWRIQRGRALEAETFKLHCAGAQPVIGFRCGEDEFERLRRYMAAIERAYHRALAQLSLEQKARRKLDEVAALSTKPEPQRTRIHIVQSQRLKAPPPPAQLIEQPESPSPMPPQPVCTPPPC